MSRDVIWTDLLWKDCYDSEKLDEFAQQIEDGDIEISLEELR